MKFWLYGIIAAIAINASAKTVYVNASSGSDDNDGTSTTSAYKTIQKAVDATVNGDVVLVAEGTYAPFSTANKKIRIVAVGEIGETLIEGNGSYKEGSNYVDLEVSNSDAIVQTNTVVIGFTILHLVHIKGGHIQRCIIKNNNSSLDGSGIAVRSLLENCLLLNNRGMNGCAAEESVLRNCTLVGNGANSYYNCVCLSCVMENCISWGNDNNNQQTWGLGEWVASYGHRDVNVYRDDPKFVDAANGDYRLAEDSPCIDAGSDAYAATCNDLDDKPRIIGDNVDIGCYEYGSAVVLGSEEKVFTTPKKSAFVFAVTSQSGTGTWKARTTDDWISLTKETGTIGSDKVSYIVSANTNAALRTGHINVNGSIHTVEQAGCGATIVPSSINADRTGCAETVSVTVSDGVCWDAASPVAWATVNPLHGFNSGTVTIEVDPYDVVAERETEIVVGGQTVTVSQRGREMELSHNETNIVASAQSASLGVTALNDVSWSILSGSAWIQVAHAGTGLGSSVVVLSIDENQSYLSRTGTVSIGTETFKIVQNRTADLSLTIAEDSVNVAATKTTAKTLKITATPDLPWTVTSNCDWLTPIERYRSGAGTTTIAYSIAANPTLAARTGKLTITPIAGSGLTARTLTVSQSAAVSTIDSTETSVTAAAKTVTVAVQVDSVVNWSVSSSANWITFEGAGSRKGSGDVVLNIAENTSLAAREGSVSIAGHTFTVQQAGGVLGISKTSGQTLSEGGTLYVDVSGSANLNWSIANACDWVSIEGESNRKGPATLVIRVDANTSIEPRTCEMMIGGQKFVIDQEAASTAVGNDVYVHSADVEIGEFDVVAPEYLTWETTTTNDWIILTSDVSTTGSGTVEYIVDKTDVTKSRIGIIWVGTTPVYICQCDFRVSLDETVKMVSGASGYGQITVDLETDDAEWCALSTVPWITVASTSGRGGGTVRYTYEDNNTGKTRSGKIVISGTAYTIEQAARMVSVKTEAGNGGSVAGGGSYSLGTEVTLTAVPADGYQFAYWEGDVESMQNPITVTADAPKSVKAVFTPLTPEFVSVSNATDGVTLVWTNLAWAAEYKIYRAPSSTRTGSPLATLVADGTHNYFDATGDVGVPYWYWVEAVGAVDTNECVKPVSGRKLKPIVISNITYENLRGTTHANPATYQEETVVAFMPPSGTVTGYIFSGWTPSGITAEMTGDQTVTANWTANSYEVQFHANGGSGTMANQAFVYDAAQALTACGFVKDGYGFVGWGRGEDAASTVADAQIVSNLTDVAGGVVELWAVWESTGGGDDPGVIHTPPEWTGVTKSDTMAVYATVLNKKNGTNVETDGSLLAAFDSTGECCGVAEIEEGPLGMLFQLSVGINSTSETGFTLKVWDAATGEITEIAETFDANADKQLGAIFGPIVYEIGALTQEVILGEGWSWISFCLTPEDAKVGTLLGGLTFANGDMLKASDKLVTYYNGVWYPSSYALKPGAAYMVKKTGGGTEAVTVEGSLMTDGLALTAGWNWFGPTTLATQTISSVTYTGGFANNDQAKSSSKVATWYGGKWYSSDFQLCPGAGYVAKLANDGKLYFGAAPSFASALLMAAVPLAFSAAPSSKPSWTPVVKSDTMAVYATIHDPTTDADIAAECSILAAFDADGECRGVATIEDGPIGKVFQLPIGLESTSETGFVLKVWDASNGTICEVVEKVDANAEKQIGQIFEPTVFTVKSVSNPIPDLGENPTTEEITNVFVEAKAEDPKLAEKITTETAYTNFSAWAKKVQPHGGGDAVGAAGVMAAPNAWLSYALGSETLLEAALTDADLTVETFGPKSGEDGKFDFTVSVKDVEVGGAAQTEAQKEQVKENLKQVFGLEGGTSLEKGGMSSANVEIEFDTPQDGKVKFTAGPKDTGAKTFFMKVKITP